MNSALYLYIYELCSFSKLSITSPTSQLILISKLSVTSPTSQLILQPFPRFTDVTTHSPTLPLLHLRHSSFSNPSFASPTSQDFHLRQLASRLWPLPFHTPLKIPQPNIFTLTDTRSLTHIDKDTHTLAHSFTHSLTYKY